MVKKEGPSKKKNMAKKVKRDGSEVVGFMIL